jgi:hypothetical protein
MNAASDALLLSCLTVPLSIRRAGRRLGGYELQTAERDVCSRRPAFLAVLCKSMIIIPRGIPAAERARAGPVPQGNRNQFRRLGLIS